MTDPTATPSSDAPPSNRGRPQSFQMDIASGMLEALGLNMYTSIGKSLSEFVANAYDADASKVEISIPFSVIAEERTRLRTRAKEEVEQGERGRFTVLVDPLPDSVEIIISDDGHGMSPAEIRDKLLVVSRNRRKDSAVSESGERYVMGRKGLGKLAGFGTAQRITIWSKRKDCAFATEFTMDYGRIENSERVAQNSFPATYYENQDPRAHGTKVTLSGLRCDSLKASEKSVREVLAQNFALLGQAFAVSLNTQQVVEPDVDYEFIYPAEDARDEDGFGEENVVVSDMLTFPIRYKVCFRAREADDPQAGKSSGSRGSLPAARRGARIYCNGRLAAGPTLFDLHTGMHNFHSQAYMECIVHADEIDRQMIDHIGTNRADLKGDSEVVEALRATVTELMRRALYEHSKFRDEKAASLVETDPFSQGLLLRGGSLSKEADRAARRLLQTLAASAGVNSELYREAAPLLFESMNAGDVLAKLIALEHDPKSLPVLAHELLELTRIENRDVIKLFRARRRGIEGLRKLVERARTSWKKGGRFENDLHRLLKENPWLVKPEFSRYLTSDQPLGDVAKQLAVELKIDSSAPPPERDGEGEIVDQDKRPDLVFTMIDGATPTVVTIVELKTPNYPLRIEHLNQLEGYMMRVGDYLKAKFSQDVSVRGFLIGDLDPASKASDVQLLNKKKRESGSLCPWEIIALPDLLERAKQVHLSAINAAEEYESFLGQELDDSPNSSLAGGAPLLLSEET